MSAKTGRNDPCPCGSGNKYKRCCLLREDVERIEAARQEALWDDDLEDDEFADGEDEFVVEDVPPFDVGAIVRIRYERGFVSRVDRVETGEGLRATEWKAPSIPQELLDSLSLEALDELDGPWGDSAAGHPIQVDLIELETDDDAVVIEILNRAMLLLKGSEDAMRLHRACGALEAFADRGVDVPAGIEPEAAAGGATEEPPAFALDEAVKAHRRQPGRCELCGAELTKAGATRHLQQCAPRHDAPTGTQHDLLHIRVTARGAPGYWLDLEMRADAKLDALDAFLRDIWVECCGHLSSFDIGGVEYASRPSDGAYGEMFGGRRRRERSMGATLGKALSQGDDRFTYAYDFGSTTGLQLDVRGIRAGRIGRQALRLIARNTRSCGPARSAASPESVCAFCFYESANPFVCVA
jgi:hypothetical protein